MTATPDSALRQALADQKYTEAEYNEAGEIGERDGYESAVQDIDIATGGDGEYFASTIPGEGCPDPTAMKARIVERFTVLTAALAPFAKAADRAEREAVSYTLSDSASPGWGIKMGDLRRAREAHALITEALQRGEKT